MLYANHDFSLQANVASTTALWKSGQNVQVMVKGSLVPGGGVRQWMLRVKRFAVGLGELGNDLVLGNVTCAIPYAAPPLTDRIGSIAFSIVILPRSQHIPVTTLVQWSAPTPSQRISAKLAVNISSFHNTAAFDYYGNDASGYRLTAALPAILEGLQLLTYGDIHIDSSKQWKLRVKHVGLGVTGMSVTDPLFKGNMTLAVAPGNRLS